MPSFTPSAVITSSPIPPAPTPSPSPTTILAALEAEMQVRYAVPVEFTSLAEIESFVSRTYSRPDVFRDLLATVRHLTGPHPCPDVSSCLARAYQNLPAGPVVRLDLPAPGQPDSDLVIFEETGEEAHLDGHFYHPQWVLDTPYGPLVHVIQDDNVGYNLPIEGGPDRYIPRIRRFLIEPLAQTLWEVTALMQARGFFQHQEVVVLNSVYRDHYDSDWLAYHFYGVDARSGGMSQHNEGFAVDLRILTPALRQFRSLTDSDVERMAAGFNQRGFFWGEGYNQDRPHVVYMGIIDQEGTLIVDGATVMTSLVDAGFDLTAVQNGQIEGLDARAFYEMFRLAVSQVCFERAQELR